MKLLAKLGAAALLAFTLAACSDPAADLKKLQAWDRDNAAAQQQIQAELQQALSTVKEPSELEPVLASYKAKVQDLVKSLDQLDIKSNEIKALKEKTKAVFLESQDVTADSLKVLVVSRTEETVNALKAKTEALNKNVEELMKLQNDLQAKFGDKTAETKPAEQAPAQPAEQAPAQPAQQPAEQAAPAQPAK
ncbi:MULTISPECIES: hypothetical protein [Basfia]|nr:MULTISPECIES: hypothetical protein [Basfia]QIM68222.1 hypothetical protein A4G13_01795 [Basfia succiniciproducens]SCX96212.1 hypothetical protein SAMN02910354_00975 [Basfia succiniciproducens]SEQ53203.1 hypothetical protein SAMN02910415_01627 [Basfia succiniciproducens]